MWQYRNPEELYHYGIQGMKWKNHVYKTYDTLQRTNKTSKSSNKKEKWSTKKKIAIGVAAVAAVSGIYLSKKYIDKANKKIARTYADKIWDRSTRNYVLGLKMGLPLKRYSGTSPKVSKNITKTLNRANTNWNRAYDKINSAKFTDKVKNIYNYKRYGTIRGIRIKKLP